MVYPQGKSWMMFIVDEGIGKGYEKKRQGRRCDTASGTRRARNTQSITPLWTALGAA